METSSIYIFEAGSTKTDVLTYNNKSKSIQSLSGFNPNRLDTNFIQELKELNIPKNANIYFYGSGISSAESIKKISSLFVSENISVHSDTLGASRALLKKEKGIVCILGTGGVVVYYDGKYIIDKHGGYGYLIDDYGGGLELSKVVVSEWLNNSFNSETAQAFENYFNLEKKEFISDFYKHKNLHHLTSICNILPDLAVTDTALNDTIQYYFNVFIQRHIYPMCKKHNIFEINLVGSIGQYYNDWIVNSTSERGIIVKKTISKPIDELLNYHLSQN